MTEQEQNMNDYNDLQVKYLYEAEVIFGQKTEYLYAGLGYHNHPPRTVLCDKDIFSKLNVFKIELNGMAINDRKDGIFQLSHEVVHLISPVEQIDDMEVNYLEEGMATYFSKVITEKETGDYEFCGQAISKNDKYLNAFMHYISLITIDVDAVKKLRAVNPIIGNIQPEDFQTAGLNVHQNLIAALLRKFE